MLSTRWLEKVKNRITGLRRIMSLARTAPLAPLAIPLLTLPLVAGALWLWMTGTAPRPAAYWGWLAGLVVLGLYALGLVLAGQQIGQRLATHRALHRQRPALAIQAGDGQGQAIWATAPSGVVLWQSPAARARFGDRSRAALTPALGRLLADPDAAIRRLIARASHAAEAGMPLAEGRLTLRLTEGGALLIWSLDTGRDPAMPEPRVIEGFDALPVALVRLDQGGRVTQANAAARVLLPGIAPGASLHALLDGLGRSVEDWLDDVLQGRITPRPEMLRSRGEGPERFVQVSLARDGAGGLIAVLSDASALKTLEAQFVQSQKMQAIGQLAGGIAHDFNNVLTAISGHCDLLMLRRDATDPDYADLQQISQNANRAAALVGQLLAFSRKQAMKPQIIDLRDTMSELTHLLRRLVTERITLSFDHDPALRPIRTDPRQLDQIVMNLVVNARDAMQDGGRIAIRTANVTLKDALSRQRVSVPGGDYVLISVTDEGCGIPPDKIGKIFEPFYTTKRVGEGTGLGLATVYGIVKQSGGYVFCDSEEGKGTTFSIYFPAHDPKELAAARAAAEAAPAARSGPARSASVLLVEDEAAVRAFAARALRLRGFEVVEADSAEAALDLLASADREFDVFVADVVMPGMDGPAWVRTALREHPQTRVIFISGYSEDMFSDGNPPVAHARFLQKPFSLTQLTDLVREEVDALHAD